MSLISSSSSTKKDFDEPAPMLRPSLKLKSNMRTHRALALSKKGNEEAKDGMPSINDFVSGKLSSGKLSTGEGLIKKTPVKEEETKNEETELTLTDLYPGLHIGIDHSNES